MAGRKTYIKRRPKGEKIEPTVAKPKGSPPSDDAVVDSDGAVRSMRRAPIQQSAPAETSGSGQRVTNDLSALEAISSMSADDLAAMYDARPMHRTLREGDRVEAQVISRVGDEFLLDVGAKAEATMDASEKPRLQPGESLTVWVTYSSGDHIQVSTRLRGDLASDFLREALEKELPVTGTVVSESNGSLNVKVGDQSAFVPAKHVDRLGTEAAETLVGQELEFLVLEAGDRVVLSRRRLQEQAIASRSEVLWSTLQRGDAVEGVVTRAMPFGVFVDVEGVEGLMPRSQITSDEDSDLGKEFPAGKLLKLEVMHVDREQKRISFAPFGQRRPKEFKPAAETPGSGATFGDLFAGLFADKK